MAIGRVSSSIEALAVAVNPHKEAVELVEQQIDELADDLARDNDIMKVSAGELFSSSNYNRQPQ